MQYSGYHVITPHVSKQKPQWAAEDLRPVANVLSAPQVIVVREGCRRRTWPSWPTPRPTRAS